MGNPIGTITFDPVVSGSDYVVGTDAVSGKTYNYRISDIGSFFVAGSTSIIDTTNVLDVTETAIKDFVAVINTLAIPWTVLSGQLPLVNVTDSSAVFDGVYMLKKAQTSTTLYGTGETQVVEADFIGLRLQNDIGESNTMSSTGGDEDLVTTKVGVDLPIKGLTAGTSISLIDTGTAITIGVSDTLGEVNTLGDVGSGTGLAGTKAASENKVKSITAVGAVMSSDATDVTIAVWTKETTTATFELVDADKFTTFECDSASAIVVTVPDDLSADFECAFIRYGAGAVSFVAGGTATILGTNTQIKAQFDNCWIQTKKADTTKIYLSGDVKA